MIVSEKLSIFRSDANWFCIIFVRSRNFPNKSPSLPGTPPFCFVNVMTSLPARKHGPAALARLPAQLDVAQVHTHVGSGLRGVCRVFHSPRTVAVVDGVGENGGVVGILTHDGAQVVQARTET